MDELNWIDKNERLPTSEDADTQGFIIAFDHRGALCYHFTNVANLPQCSHWIGFKQLNESVPAPKRWRVPTIHDLAKAGKPIPCRVRDNEKGAWNQNMKLDAISFNPEACHKFYCGMSTWRYCEICDE